MTDIYTPAINTLVEQIKGDKSLDPKWRNKAIGRLEEADVFLDAAKTRTSRKAPDDVADPITAPFCTCPEGGNIRTCPVHGWET